MNPDDHLAKAQRLQETLGRLNEEADYEIVVETCYAAALHLIACVAERRRHRHRDTHKGLAHFLDEEDLPELAAVVREFETLRTASFYGGKRNGNTARRAKHLLGEVEAKLH